MNIISVPSPNYTRGRKGYAPIAIVVHIMEGTLAGTDSWFRSTASQVSAHYGIGKDGSVHQYVQESDSAWHAGRVNAPSWRLIKSSGGKYVNPNYYTIGIEHEGNADSNWTDAMYATSSEMLRTLSSRWNIPLDRDHIIGHHEIYSLKTCPGHKVDINKLISLAGGTTAPVPVVSALNRTAQSGKVTTVSKLNIRTQPDSSKVPVAVVPPSIQLAYDGYVDNGEAVNGNSKWYYTDEGNWFWSGGVR